MTRKKISLAILSGLLLTGSFPNINMDWLAWFALVPLLTALTSSSDSDKGNLKESFYLGFVTGLVHYLTLIYWIAHTMKIYGYLPLYICIPVLFLFASYLALYSAIFSMLISIPCSSPVTCFFMLPVLWVSLEYIRSFLFSGFPWELIGYSQFNHLHLIQISDIFGVYGVSFLIALSNGTLFFIWLYLKKMEWQGIAVTKRFVQVIVSFFILILGSVWFYGEWRINTAEKLISNSPSLKVSVVQGNIDQTIKWDPEFQYVTTKKYIDLSLSVKKDNPDLIVWTETATPFYFLYNLKMTQMVKEGIKETGTHFLIGSPYFTQREKDKIDYYNSAYLIKPDGEVTGKYDKAHLVPFGEYVPLKKWLPFIGKMVEQVGDFIPGKEGETIDAEFQRSGNKEKIKLGIQICYEIIFPNLSRMMAKNDAGLLINITNDAWYGRTGAPYQHFSMAIFRAVENKRTLIRSANTGISGFISPVGKVIASTQLFEDAVIIRDVPVIQSKTIYTRFGDWFSVLCCVFVSLCLCGKIKESIKGGKRACL